MVNVHNCCTTVQLWSQHIPFIWPRVVRTIQREKNSGVPTGDGGPDPLTSVQTPPEINANPLKSCFIYRGVSHACIFYCSPTMKKVSDPHFFGVGDAIGEKRKIMRTTCASRAGVCGRRSKENTDTMKVAEQSVARQSSEVKRPSAYCQTILFRRFSKNGKI